MAGFRGNNYSAVNDDGISRAKAKARLGWYSKSLSFFAARLMNLAVPHLTWTEVGGHCRRFPFVIQSDSEGSHVS
jgi:hypothetical protein